MAVVLMGVLIVAGVGVLMATLATRMSSGGGAIASAILDEPAGTAIAGTTLAQDRLALQLHGGGPDRVVVVDTKSGRVLGRVALAR